MTEPRLFGTPGAEVMYFTLAECYEHDIDPWVDQPDHRPETIEEWTVYPPAHHLPHPARIIEWAAEWAADNGEVDERGDENISDRGGHPDVVAAFEAAVAVWASKITYRVAHTQVADHRITWDGDGTPRSDGQPIYGGDR